MQEALLIMVIVALSATIQGLTGFGFGIMAVSLMPLILGFGDAIALMSLLVMVVTGLMFFRTRQNFEWKDCRILQRTSGRRIQYGRAASHSVPLLQAMGAG